MQAQLQRPKGMMPRVLAFLSVLALQVLLAPGATAQTPTALLPLNGDSESRAAGINNRGAVAGVSFGNGAKTAVVWNRRGKPRALLPLDGDTDSEAKAINGRGEVVGSSGDSGGGLGTVVVWDRGGTPRALPPLDGDSSAVADGINIHGEVVGTSFGSGGATAVVWDESGIPRALPSFPVQPPSDSLSSRAYAINNRGKVAGISYNSTPSGETIAVMWRRNGMPIGLQPPAGDGNSVGTAINARGEVVGRSYTTAEAVTGTRAVMWDRRHKPTVLPTLDGVNDDSDSDDALAINARGLIAGTSFDNGASRAVVWDRGGAPNALQPLPGDTGSRAVAINNRGEVAGGSFGNGPQTAVVWR